MKNKPPAVYKCRIPYQFFRTKGTGESDITRHAGDYHLALNSAGIANQNIICYSSILPKEAVETQRPMELHHGAVMEVIMSKVETEKGIPAICGIRWSKLMNRETGEPAGGIVVERYLVGTDDEAKIAEELQKSIVEVYQNGFMDKYDITVSDMITEKITPQKRYGTAICALCFHSYIWEEIKSS